MKLIEIIIQNILILYFILTYAGITLGLLIGENLLLRRKDFRKVHLLLTGLAILSLAAFILIPSGQKTSYADIQKLDVHSGAESIGTQMVMVERNAENPKEKELKLLGKFVTNEDAGSRYFAVQADDGKISCPEYPEAASAIEKTLEERQISIKNFQGGSSSYQQLKDEAENLNLKQETTANAAAVKGGVIFLPVLICILRYVQYRRKQEKERMLKKMKLMDI